MASLKSNFVWEDLMEEKEERKCVALNSKKNITMEDRTEVAGKYGFRGWYTVRKDTEK